LSKLSGFNKVSTVPAGVLQMQRYCKNSKGPSLMSTKFAAFTAVRVENLRLQLLHTMWVSATIVVSIATAVESTILLIQLFFLSTRSSNYSY
jgi:hypothetical protein